MRAGTPRESWSWRSEARRSVRTLVAGRFSFEGMGATAGDLLARDVVCGWLEQAARAYDVAQAPPFVGGVDWRAVDPERYASVLFVCGPFGNGWPLTDFLQRFAGSQLVGLNLSMLEPLEVWNPFHALFARDSSQSTLPDLTFVSVSRLVPVVGVVLVHRQKEYRGGLHEAVHAAIHRVIAARDITAVPIDSRLDVNATGLSTPAQVESLIARMDAVLTTRLHGLVLALKHGVPAVAVDPIAGGAKILRQAETIGWPVALPGESLTDEALAHALDYCLTGEARDRARACRQRGLELLYGLRDRVLTAVGGGRI
jgi:glycosyltransferase involved in cell wall biosynthesis